MSPENHRVTLCPVTPLELAAAYGIYLEVAGWLKDQGVRQWLHVLPESEFRGRQERGELFAAHQDNHLVAIVTLALEPDPDWPEVVGSGKNWWLKTLAVGRAHRGRDLGAEVMQACAVQLTQSGAREVWLECVDAGFLPDYYTRFGYEVIKRKTVTYASGNTFAVALMRLSLT